jgi:hypothetical protein
MTAMERTHSRQRASKEWKNARVDVVSELRAKISTLCVLDAAYNLRSRADPLLEPSTDAANP